MKCPHCGKEISEYAITCPNCGGNPKGKATEEVKEKVKIVENKTNNTNKKILIAGIAIAALGVLFPYYFGIPALYGGTNRIIEIFVYIVISVILIGIMIKCNSFKVIIKDIAFYVSAVVAAILDFVLDDVRAKSMYGSDSIKMMREYARGIAAYDIAKVLNIVVLILGVALVVTLLKMKRKCE